MIRASQLKVKTPTKLISKEKAQNGKMLGSKASGVVVSKKDEKAHPEDFKYLQPKKSTVSVKTKTVTKKK